MLFKLLFVVEFIIALRAHVLARSGELAEALVYVAIAFVLSAIYVVATEVKRR